MIGSTNLIHPMTAGDLVESVMVVAQRDGRIVFLRVFDVERINDFVSVKFHDTDNGSWSTLQMKASTPLLFTDIRI